MLKVQDLYVNYGSIVALQGISFEVHKGEIVSLVGANGAGKSTTLKTISGLLKPKSGKIFFKGKAIENKKSYTIVQNGVVHVPEGRQIFSKMTVAENLRLGGYNVKNKAIYDERLEKSYELFPKLKERYKQSAGTLSGGEQQMLAIARGLMSGPELLLLDEPSLGLAPIVVQQVFEVVKELKASGITILLVEQNAYDALKISDRAYIMETGKIVLSGTGEELIGNKDVQNIYLGGDL
ncbi:MAG: ABC transporter ATP-binding protein [Lachnospiraceae bacterium]|nr:ABC transporter ATP-binding protein [Lachnospiraceae bacterium]